MFSFPIFQLILDNMEYILLGIFLFFIIYYSIHPFRLLQLVDSVTFYLKSWNILSTDDRVKQFYYMVRKKTAVLFYKEYTEKEYFQNSKDDINRTISDALSVLPEGSSVKVFTEESDNDLRQVFVVNEEPYITVTLGELRN
ncbi:MAG: hypothetical protein H7A25_08045 [Leptospiraceae bacterium]|nr:hypothetical protein [Leptospiraceae bacterium]MCP5499837.1 hypothetical protein [Leptospiraceae bacterium]